MTALERCGLRRREQVPLRMAILRHIDDPMLHVGTSALAAEAIVDGQPVIGCRCEEEQLRRSQVGTWATGRMSTFRQRNAPAESLSVTLQCSFAFEVKVKPIKRKELLDERLGGPHHFHSCPEE